MSRSKLKSTCMCSWGSVEESTPIIESSHARELSVIAWSGKAMEVRAAGRKGKTLGGGRGRPVMAYAYKREPTRVGLGSG